MKRKGFSWLNAILLLASLGVFAAVLFPVLARMRENAGHPSCQSNLKQIGLGILQYQQDYDERWPPVATWGSAYGWADSLQPYLKSTRVYHCPRFGSNVAQTNPTRRNYTDYCFNANLSSQYSGVVKSPAQTIMSGDGNDGYDVNDARYTLFVLPQAWLNLPSSPAYRHLGTTNLLFADGHVKAFKGDSLTINGPRRMDAMYPDFSKGVTP